MSSFPVLFDAESGENPIPRFPGGNGTGPNLWTTRARGLWSEHGCPVDDLWET